MNFVIERRAAHTLSQCPELNLSTRFLCFLLVRPSCKRPLKGLLLRTFLWNRKFQASPASLGSGALEPRLHKDLGARGVRFRPEPVELGAKQRSVI